MSVLDALIDRGRQRVRDKRLAALIDRAKGKTTRHALRVESRVESAHRRK